jgi:hypothetical protein
MPEMITIEAREDDRSEQVSVQQYDFDDPEDIRSVLLTFGNGCFCEARVEAATAHGIRLFIALLNKGGYFIDRNARPTGALYRSGYGCFPEADPFIYVNPIAMNGEVFPMDNVHSPDEWRKTIRKRWWQFWIRS